MSLTTAAEPQSLALEVGEDVLAYFRMGSGPALVIVHGVGGHKEDWTRAASALAGTRTVYAIDMLGFGASSREAKELGMAAQAKAIKELLDAGKIDRADLIGNSVGGWAAATFAASYPERVNKLVLVDPAGFRAMFEGAPPVNLFPDSIDEMKKLLSFVLFSGFAHTDEFAAQAFASFERSGEKSLVARLYPQLFASRKLEELLPEVKAPSLVVWGEEDKLFPAALAPYIAKLIPGAAARLVPRASHFPHIDNPDAFIEAVATFLQK